MPFPIACIMLVALMLSACVARTPLEQAWYENRWADKEDKK